MKIKDIVTSIFFILLLCVCKEKEKSLENEDPFYMEDEGCNLQQAELKSNVKFDCLTKKEDLLCFKLFERVKALQFEQFFKNTKWSSPDNEATFNYFFDKNISLTILLGGPSKTIDEYEEIGRGRIYKEKDTWLYEHACQNEICEDLIFPIEYFKCDAMFHPSDEQYHLSVTLGNRFYNFLNKNKNEKHLSIEFNGIVKPQIRNGFELYLVPPAPK